tara:strand:- start:963 stop:2045 length:1083 start_codon:yes stop_codon:yes gene_type:complete
MYKTKLGLRNMDVIAKRHPRLVTIFANLGIVVGFIGMVAIFVLLIASIISIYKNPVPQAGVALLLPGVQVPGLPVLSFWHWIIALFILVVVHEFMHGVVARLHNIKIKSSGFAFLCVVLPVVPAAFVEPEETQLVKKSKKAQLGVFSAGSMSNFIVAIIFFLVLTFVINPIAPSLIETSGVRVVATQEGYPLAETNIQINEEIEEVNGILVSKIDNFIDIMKDVKPGGEVSIKTNTSVYNVLAATHPEDSSRGYVGVFLDVVSAEIRSDIWWASSFFWIQLAVLWIYLINFFVGLFNLLPLFILDGGRMFYTFLSYIFKNNEIRVKKVFNIVNVICVLLIILNFFPSLIKFFGNILVSLF